MLNLSLLGCLEVVVFWLETKNNKNNKKTSFNEINGFLSLQLELRMELGLGLRLTNIRHIVPAVTDWVQEDNTLGFHLKPNSYVW